MARASLEPRVTLEAGVTRHAARVAIAAALAAVLSGCAGPAPERRPPLTPSPSVTPAFPVPSSCERMVWLARQEWALFGSPEVLQQARGGQRLQFPEAAGQTHELHPPMLARVLAYWYATSRAPVVGSAGELRPWSAAFVSWLARGAGHTADEFPQTVLHWDYIERFMRPRANDAFETRDPTRHAPRVGDLVCNGRGGTADGAARTNGVLPFAELRRGAYHCDLVVGARTGEVQVIGGNVADVVAMTRLPVDADGRLLPDPRRPWAAVVARRGAAEVSACASAAPPIPSSAPAPAR
jgi:hypothetical protein